MSVVCFANEPLALHSSYRVGGLADEFYKIDDVENFREILSDTICNNIPYIIIGSGTNILFDDKGFRGRVIQFTGKSREILTNNNKIVIRAETGINLNEFIQFCLKNHCKDIQNLAGIPGTLGGAIFGNAGAHNWEISDFISSVEFIDNNGNIQKISRENCKFNYRTSFFSQNPTNSIIRATFEFEKTDNEDTEIVSENQKLSEIIKNRTNRIPTGAHCGSFFKNVYDEKSPPQRTGLEISHYAGELLEKAGAKNDKIGGAQISNQHANFIINKNNATSSDIKNLAKKWQKIVYEKFNIKLEPEVRIVGEKEILVL